MFGAGGYELLIILAVIVLLFVPGILVFGAGFLMGKKAGEKQAEAGRQAEQHDAMAGEAAHADEADETDGDTNV